MGWPVTVALSPVKALEITPRFEGVLVCSLTSSCSRAVLLDLSEVGRSKPALPSLCLVCWALPPPSEPQGVSVPGTASGWEQPWSQARAHGLALQHMEWAWKRRGAVSVLQERSSEGGMSCGGRSKPAGAAGAQTQHSCPAFHRCSLLCVAGADEDPWTGHLGEAQ